MRMKSSYLIAGPWLSAVLTTSFVLSVVITLLSGMPNRMLDVVTRLCRPPERLPTRTSDDWSFSESLHRRDLRHTSAHHQIPVASATPLLFFAPLEIPRQLPHPFVTLR